MRSSAKLEAKPIKKPAPGKKARRTAGKWEKPSPELISLFQKIASSSPKAEQRKMFGCPVAFVNGNMFFSVHQRNLVVRLPETDREQLIGQKLAVPFVPMPGMTMREYVCLGKTIVSDEHQVAHWFKRALAYTQDLPAKKNKNGGRK
jgi:TfoX/Sxy family transcriptional regulator of competence genes